MSVSDFLESRPLRNVEVASDHTSSSSVTNFTSRAHRRVGIVRGWQGFVQEATDFLSLRQNEYQNRPVLPDYFDLGEAASENSVAMLWWWPHIGRNFNKILLHGQIREHSALSAGGPKGRPDFVLKSNTGDVETVIEIKSPWAFAAADDYDIVVEYSRGDKKTIEVITQMYTYMSFEKLKYGVLSTYNKTWFFRRPGSGYPNTLEIFGPVTLAHTGPTLFQALMYILDRREDTFKHDSPFKKMNSTQILSPSQSTDRGSPTPAKQNGSPLPFLSLVTESNEHRSNPSGMVEYDITPDHFEDALPLGSGKFGSVYQISYHGQQVAAKIIDVSSEECAESVRRELSAYSRLTEFQGNYVPRLLGIGQYGPLVFLVEEPIPFRIQNPAPADVKLDALTALRKIHSKGVLHGDISKDNLMMREDGAVVVLDFGHSEIVENLTEMKEMGENECYLLAQTLDDL